MAIVSDQTTDKSTAVVAMPGSAILATVARRRGTVETDDHEQLAVCVQSVPDALDLALDLRRWAVHGRCGSSSLRVGVTAHTARAPLAATLGRAKRLAESVEPGVIGVERSLAARAERRHAISPRGAAPGPPRLTWSPNADVRDPIPSPVVMALDRAWPMVGRRTPLAEIGEAWARTVAGAGGALLISGEPGIGKSRLLAESVAEAHAGGGTVLIDTEGRTPAPSFGSFGAALSQLHKLRPELLGEPRIARALDRLRASGGEWRRYGDGQLGDERAVLFDLFAGVFEHLCALEPTLLAVEDLHAGDSSSLALFDFLLRRAIPRLLIVATYRSTEIEPDSAQERWLSSIRSAPGVRHLALSGLPARELADLAGAFETISPDERQRLAGWLEDETRGNPLYASELLRRAAETDGGWPIEGAPGSLSVLIEERTRALGEPAVTHLRAAALAGPRFSPELVANAVGASRRELDMSLLGAQRRGLILPTGDGDYEFSHALTARYLAETVGSEEAGRLHRAFAESLERELGAAAPSRAADLARHWSLAAPPAARRAVHYIHLAGRQALDALDHDLAAGCFERGLEIQAALPDADRALRCDLLLGLGQARRYRGADFRDTLIEAARIAAELGDGQRLMAAAIANTRGFVSAAGHFDRERAALLELAIERTHEDQAPERALALAQLALELTFTGNDRRRGRMADEALRIARSAGDEGLLARVLIRRLIALWGPVTLEARIGEAAESAAIATALDEPLDLFHGLHWQGMALIEVGRPTEAARLLDDSAAIARRLGDLTALWLAEFGRTCLLMMRGELDQAEASAQAALELGQKGHQPDALPFYASQIAAVRWHQGRLGELADLLAGALAEHPGIPGMRSLVVLTLAIAGEHERALAELRIDSSTGFRSVPRDPIWLPVLVTYAHGVSELAAAGDADLELAAWDLDRLVEPFETQVASTTVSVWGAVAHCRGRLAAVRGERELAVARLQDAITFYESLGAPVWRGLACRHLAEIEMEGRGPKARARAERWRAEAVRAAVEHEASELIRATGQRASSDDAVRKPPVTGTSDLGLSERQAEVARLAAEGLSNAMIAEQLHISPSTVKHHLHSAYRQLGVRGRAELARRLVGNP